MLGPTFVTEQSLFGFKSGPEYDTKSYFEVAEGDSWKRDVAGVFCPVGVGDEMFHHVDAERRVPRRQDAVQDEQLSQHVDDVAQLREQEQHHQVVPQSARTTCKFVLTVPRGCVLELNSFISF